MVKRLEFIRENLDTVIPCAVERVFREDYWSGIRFFDDIYKNALLIGDIDPGIYLRAQKVEITEMKKKDPAALLSIAKGDYMACSTLLQYILETERKVHEYVIEHLQYLDLEDYQRIRKECLQQKLPPQNKQNGHWKPLNAIIKDYFPDCPYQYQQKEYRWRLKAVIYGYLPGRFRIHDLLRVLNKVERPAGKKGCKLIIDTLELFVRDHKLHKLDRRKKFWKNEIYYQLKH